MHSEAQVTHKEMSDPLPEAVLAVAAAAEQITLALQEAQQPVEQLGASVSRIIVTVGTLRGASGGLSDPEREALFRNQMDGAIARLSHDAAEATVMLQFYDRMTQHLTHLHDYLAGISELLASRAVPSGPAREAPGWPELREKLNGRLISDLQRKHLQGVAPAEWSNRPGPEVESLLRSSGSSVELF